MKRLEKTTALLLCAMLFSGCFHFATDPVRINRVVFYNHSGAPLDAVHLMNPQNARLAGCSRLEPGAFFEVGFPVQAYTGSPAVLRQVQAGRPQTQELSPFRFAAGVSASDFPAVVVIAFRPGGEIVAQLEPGTQKGRP